MNGLTGEPVKLDRAFRDDISSSRIDGAALLGDEAAVLRMLGGCSGPAEALTSPCGCEERRCRRSWSACSIMAYVNGATGAGARESSRMYALFRAHRTR